MNINVPYLLSYNKRKLSLQDIQHSLMDFGFICSEHSPCETFFLMCCYYCKYVSLEEMQYYFCLEGNTNGSTWKTITNRLVTKKLILKFNLPKKDSHATTVYYLSSTGYQSIVNAYIGNDTIINPMKRRGDKLVPHDYSVGMNFMELYHIASYFVYKREYMVGEINRSKSGSLCIDALVQIKDKTLYLEEDLLTEHTKTLVEKINTYDQYGLLNDTDNQILVFSIRQPFLRKDMPAFSKISCEILSERFSNDSSLYQLYKEADSVRNTYLLQKQADIKHHKRTNFMLPDGRYIDSNGIDTLEDILKNAGIIDERGSRISKKDFSGMELLDYANSLFCNQNPYLQVAFHQDRYLQTRSVLYKMVQYLLQNRSSGAYWAALRGGQVYCITTSLLEKIFHNTPLRSILAAGVSYEELMENLLHSYYPTMLPGSYIPKSGWLGRAEEKEYHFCLRNGWEFQPIKEDGSFMEHIKGTVYIENISYDLGGYIRALHCCNHYPTNAPVHLILLVNNLKEAQDFLSFSGYRPPKGEKILFDRFFLSFAFQEKVSVGGARLFTVDTATNKLVYLT